VPTSPSIVPGGEKDIYLVLDDFSRLGRAWRETDERELTARRWSATYSKGSMKIRSVSSPSILLRAGLAT
jgi:hypothetical protein